MSPNDDLIDRFLPAELANRLPAPPDRAWRGRTVLALWALGYPLPMAWRLGMAEDPKSIAAYRADIAALDDVRLISLLESTTEARGDGTEISFALLD